MGGMKNLRIDIEDLARIHGRAVANHVSNGTRPTEIYGALARGIVIIGTWKAPNSTGEYSTYSPQDLCGDFNITDPLLQEDATAIYIVAAYESFWLELNRIYRFCLDAE